MSTDTLLRPSIPAQAGTVSFEHLGVTWGFRVTSAYPAHTIERVHSAESDVHHARACEAVAGGRLEVLVEPITPDDVALLTQEEAQAWFHATISMLRSPVTSALPAGWTEALLTAVAVALRDRGDLRQPDRGR